MPLVAGPLRLDYDGGDIRCVRLGDEEILRRIYVVFQDRNWTARPWRIVSEVIDDSGDSFRIEVTASGTFDAEPFIWTAVITGTADGTLNYAMTGSARAPFTRNRLGICVLHPMADFAGRACDIVHTDGSVEGSAFPDALSPHQPFLDIAAMSYPVGPGLARLDFAGEVFETEDHRNWSDASYKTYCTPISLPFPVELQAGEAVEQAVTLTLTGVPPVAAHPLPSGPIDIRVADDAMPLPAIGVHLTAPAWTPSERDDLRALGLAHLHVDIDASDAAQASQLIRDAGERAASIDARLLIAVHVDGESDPALAQELADLGDHLEGIWVVHPEEKVTARATIDAWRSRLGADLPWGCGTNLYFTELNRQPPDTSGLDWTTFTTNPQVHAHDDRSILQNAATLEVIARDAPRLTGNTRLHVGPITLRPRFNPNATDPASDVSSTDLPSHVDARQRTWLGAAWTFLALRSLSAPGTVSAVTLFDDLGWGGLRARDSGPEDPAFASRPGEIFPVYDVLGSITAASAMHPTVSERPEVVDALVVDTPLGMRAVLVNLSDMRHDAHLTGAVDVSVTLEPHAIVTIDLPGRAP